MQSNNCLLLYLKVRTLSERLLDQETQIGEKLEKRKNPRTTEGLKRLKSLALPRGYGEHLQETAIKRAQVSLAAPPVLPLDATTRNP